MEMIFTAIGAIVVFLIAVFLILKASGIANIGFKAVDRHEFEQLRGNLPPPPKYDYKRMLQAYMLMVEDVGPLVKEGKVPDFVVGFSAEITEELGRVYREAKQEVEEVCKQQK